MRTSEIISFIVQKNFDFVKREGNLIDYKCKLGHINQININQVSQLNNCKDCKDCNTCLKKIPAPVIIKKDILGRYITNTFWKKETEIYDEDTIFTLKCDKGHLWKGNIKKFKKLKSNDCKICRLNYLIKQITPITQVNTDVKHLKDIIEVVENDEIVKYNVKKLLKKYDFL